MNKDLVILYPNFFNVGQVRNFPFYIFQFHGVKFKKKAAYDRPFFSKILLNNS